MKLSVELDRGTDRRWIAEIPALPGVLVYGTSRDEAIAHAKVLAFRVLADRLEHGEILPDRERPRDNLPNSGGLASPLTKGGLRGVLAVHPGPTKNPLQLPPC